MANALDRPLLASATARAEEAPAWAPVGGYVPEGGSAGTDAFLGSMSSTASGHRLPHFRIANKIGLLSAGIAAMAARLQILRSIVLTVVVDVIDNQGTLFGPTSWKPVHHLLAPMTRMGAWANFVPEDQSVPGHRFEVAPWLKWVLFQPHEKVASHATA